MVPNSVHSETYVPSVNPSANPLGGVRWRVTADSDTKLVATIP
jgi:hypothetical protein